MWPVTHNRWSNCQNAPDSKVHKAYTGTTWSRRDPAGHHVIPMNLAIRGVLCFHFFMKRKFNDNMQALSKYWLHAWSVIHDRRGISKVHKVSSRDEGYTGLCRYLNLCCFIVNWPHKSELETYSNVSVEGNVSKYVVWKITAIWSWPYFIDMTVNGIASTHTQEIAASWAYYR